MKYKDLTGQKFGRLTVLSKAGKNKHKKIKWKCLCDCGNKITVLGMYLRNGDTRSCGCLKKELEEKHFRKKYDEKRVDGVAMHLFTEKPRKDSSTGYKGVQRYYTRKSKEERFRAYITVKGKVYKKAGFKTAKDAYYHGRLVLEDKYLPKKDGEK